MSNLLKGLVLQQNPAERSRIERISKLMSKVYAAKITSEEMPFVHAMYQNHHRKFCRKLDQKYEAEVKERLQNVNISQILGIRQENSSNSSSISLLNRLNESNDSDPLLRPMRFGGEYKAESEIKTEMKKKAGGEVIGASEIKAGSQIRKIDVRKEESQEMEMRQLETKRKEMQKLKEEEELKRENERKRQQQEQRQRQQEKERKRKEEVQRKERQRLKEKEQRQKRQRLQQQRQAEEERLAIQAENEKKKAIALKEQQRRQEERKRAQQQRLALLKLEQQRQANHSDDDVEVVQDDSQSYYNIRQQLVEEVFEQSNKVTRSEIAEPAKDNIFLSHLTSPKKDSFQQHQSVSQEKPEIFLKQQVKCSEMNQPSQHLIEQSASLTQSHVNVTSKEEGKIDSSLALKLGCNVEQSPPSESLSPLSKNILSGFESIQNAKEQPNDNNEGASVLLQSQVIQQSQKQEHTLIQSQENVGKKVDKIANTFIQFLQRQPSKCEYHQSLLKQNALIIAQLSKRNEQLLKQQEEIIERSRKNAITAELKIIDLEKQLKELREKLQQEQFYMVKPTSKVIKRNNSAGKVSDQSKEVRGKAYNSGEQSLKEESKSQKSYQSNKNSSDEQP